MVQVPLDEHWILQGCYVENSNAGGLLPLELDARIASGTNWYPTEASIVLRHLRISRQLATFKRHVSGIGPDGVEYSIPYSMQTGSFCQGTLCGPNSGGAFEYWGGHQAQLVFDNVVFDHCVAMRAGAIMLDGASVDPSGIGTTLTMTNSIIWSNLLQAGGVYSGGMILYNMWPVHLTFTDTHWIDNDGYAGHMCIIAWVPNPRLGLVGSELTGNSSIAFVRNTISGPDRVYRNFGDNNGAALATGAMIVFQTAIKMQPPHRLDVIMDDCTIHDNLGNTQGQGLMQLNNPSGLAIPREEVPFVVTTWRNTDSTENFGTANQLQAGSVWHSTGGGETLIEKSRFEGNGCTELFDAPAGIVLLMGTLSGSIATVVDSSFINNVNGGAAGINFMGDGDLHIVRSSFLENAVRAIAGAVQAGSGGANLFVTESLFARNEVLSSGLIDVVVRVYTGGTGGTDPDDEACWLGECINAIWKIDGIVPDALTGSTPAEETVYGDVDYEPGNLYAHVVTLEAGVHTLWTGAVLNSKDPETNWPGGAYIDIVSILDPVQPSYYDNRGTPDAAGVVRNAGCMSAAGNPSDFENPCATGESFWGEPVEFTVGKGEGGAISTTTTGTITIHDTIFDENDAWDGHSLRVVKAASLYVENTTFEAAALARPDAQAVSTQGVEQHTCADRYASRCEVSQRCLFQSSSVFCQDCAVNEYGDRKKCFPCLSGTEPNVLKDGCTPCSPGEFSELGICDDCGPGTTAAESGQVVCDVCPTQTVPDSEHTQCLCSTGTYNSSTAIHVCYSRGFDAGQLQDSLDLHASTPADIDCDFCPTDETGEVCLLCEDGLGAVKEGFVAPLLLDEDHATVSVFRCHNDMSTGVKRCPGSSSGAARRLEETSQCNIGYTGIICGECSEGFGMRNSECVPCDDVGYNWQSFLVLLAVVVCVFVAFFLLGKKWRNFPLKHVIRCSAQPLRMLITYSQVTSQLGDILDFNFPGLFGDVIEFLRPLIDLWGLLFRALGPSECFGFAGFNSRWYLRVLGLPGMMSFVVFIIYLVQLKMRDHVEAMGAAKSNFAFVVFFCYPTICIVAFAAFMCRPLTAEKSFLELDDAVFCEDSSHVAMQVASGIVIVVVSISLPVALLVMLVRKARSYDLESRDSYTPVAKRLAVDLGVDVSTAAFAVRDIVLGRDFSFVMDAYNPKYLWWEAIDMLRKLVLVGLVLLAGRGSVFQLSVALVMSFSFFALHILTLPYKVMADNAFRAATELHVFVAIAVALVYKTDLSLEKVTADAYDAVLFATFILLVPVAFVVTVCSKVRYMAHVVENALSTDEIPAAEVRRRAFELHVLGLSSDTEKQVLRRFIEGWSIKKRYAAFLSHFKAEAAAEARILKLELVKALRTPDEKIFLDADSLSDLRELQAQVTETDVFILMLTDGVLSRPWCLAELVAAANAQVPIVVLNINNSFHMHGAEERVVEILNDLPAYLQQKNPSAAEALKGIDLDVTTIGPLILTAISAYTSATTSSSSDDGGALTFDPNQSSVMLQSQISALAIRMVKTACPENAVLLPDLLPKQPEPWVVCRQIAVYILYSEQASEEESAVHQLAEEVKAWLHRRCDLEPHHIVLCTKQDDQIMDKRSIDEATALDCNLVAKATDTVLLLQSASVLAEPRSLARLYSASVNRVPIVPIFLTGAMDHGHEWDFDQAKSTFSALGSTLSAQAVSSLETATGVSTATIGDELLQAIPNVISKPLSVGGANTEFEAQMCDIELTLRRDMAKVGNAVERTAGTEGTKSSSMAQPKPATKPRTVARVVARRSATPPRKSANQEAPPSESVPPEP